MWNWEKKKKKKTEYTSKKITIVFQGCSKSLAIIVLLSIIFCNRSSTEEEKTHVLDEVLHSFVLEFDYENSIFFFSIVAKKKKNNDFCIESLHSGGYRRCTHWYVQ